MAALKYKTGDKVLIKDLDWYNENKDEDGDASCDKCDFVSHMSAFCGKILTIDVDFEDGTYMMKEDTDKFVFTDEMIEGLVEDPVLLAPNITEGVYIHEKDMKWTTEYILPDGYIFKDENGNVINATKIILEKKKKEYPKTYEECCKVLGLSEFEYNHTGTKVWYRHKLMATLDKLMLCHDAYWKLYGEEMGLSKPWKPDYNDLKKTYGLYNELKYTIINPAIFVFPTEEMRDAFYENFKELIENCKELL